MISEVICDSTVDSTTEVDPCGERILSFKNPLAKLGDLIVESEAGLELVSVVKFELCGNTSIDWVLRGSTVCEVEIDWSKVGILKWVLISTKSVSNLKSYCGTKVLKESNSLHYLNKF